MSQPKVCGSGCRHLTESRDTSHSSTTPLSSTQLPSSPKTASRHWPSPAPHSSYLKTHRTLPQKAHPGNGLSLTNRGNKPPTNPFALTIPFRFRSTVVIKVRSHRRLNGLLKAVPFEWITALRLWSNTFPAPSRAGWTRGTRNAPTGPQLSNWVREAGRSLVTELPAGISARMSAFSPASGMI